ncbi:MAG TPA: hypothetical protein VMU59_13675 [Caulobacteraceae bacterium]|nr:hypothetical protein [Caulobacteraceae bacterium]
MFKSERMKWGRVAWGWLLLGLVFIAISIGVAVGHYAFGMPIHEGHSGGRLATSTEILTTLVAFGAGGSLFAVMGGAILLCRRKG